MSNRIRWGELFETLFSFPMRSVDDLGDGGLCVDLACIAECAKKKDKREGLVEEEVR